MGRRARRVRAGLVSARSNALEGAVALLVALGIGGSTLIGAKAGGAWSQAIREEIKSSAAAVEDIRSVYADEAPAAYELAVREERARQLRLAGAVADGSSGLLLAEAGSETRLVENLRLAHRGRGGLIDGPYRGGDGYDVVRRLADVRGQHAELVALDPGATMRAGDRFNAWSTALWAATVLLVLAFVAVTASPWGRARLRRRSRRGRPGETDLNAIPAALGPMLAAWLLLTLIPGLQQYCDNAEQRARAVSARHASQLQAAVAGSGLAASFREGTVRGRNLADIYADSRLLGALDSPDPRVAAAQAAYASAEAAALPGVGRVATAMGRLPSDPDGIDRRTRAILTSGEADWRALLDRQLASLARADRYGERGDRLILALGLAAIAQTLLAFAAVARPPTRARTIRRSGLYALAATVGCALSTLLI